MRCLKAAIEARKERFDCGMGSMKRGADVLESGWCVFRTSVDRESTIPAAWNDYGLVVIVAVVKVKIGGSLHAA